MGNYEKKYKEALEWMRGLYPSFEGCIKEDAELFFPELKESKGERIKKAIMHILTENYTNAAVIEGVEIAEIVAWLEKQSKETSWKPSKEEMDVLYSLSYITNQYDDYKEEVITRLYQDLKREFFNGANYENMFPTNTNTEDNVRRRSTIQILEYARSLDNYNQYGKADIDKNIAWLEKQDKQLNPDDVIAWMQSFGCDVDNLVETFKKHFEI